MKLLFIINEYNIMSGCLYVRNILPARKLQELGHEIHFMILGKDVPSSLLDWADVVIFSRHYNNDVVNVINYLKDRKKRLIYEIDDDLESLLLTSPPKVIDDFLQVNLKSINNLCEECDLITTSTEYLAEKLERRTKKPIHVIPNMIDFDFYKPRYHKSKELRVGWSGGGTHPNDLFLIIDAIKELQKKYKFVFYLQGLTSMPLSAFITSWRLMINSGLFDINTLHPDVTSFLKLEEELKSINFVHIPYYPVAMFPEIMREVDLDIGLCPLIDKEFNHCKSCNKYYEYTALDTVTIASDVIPYSNEVPYTVKNNTQDWYKGIEKLIKDKTYRKDLLEESKRFIINNRNAADLGKLWEKVLFESFKNR